MVRASRPSRSAIWSAARTICWRLRPRARPRGGRSGRAHTRSKRSWGRERPASSTAQPLASGLTDRTAYVYRTPYDHGTWYESMEAEKADAESKRTNGRGRTGDPGRRAPEALRG